MIIVFLHHLQNDFTLSCISELPHASARLHITQFDRPSHPVQMILFDCLLADIEIIAQKALAVNLPKDSTKARPIGDRTRFYRIADLKRLFVEQIQQVPVAFLLHFPRRASM